MTIIEERFELILRESPKRIQRKPFIEFVPAEIVHLCQAKSCNKRAIYRTGIPYSRYWGGPHRTFFEAVMRRWACEPHGVRFAQKYNVKLPIEFKEIANG